MSFSSHKKKVFDNALPLEHKASHARSCALHVANALQVKREVVIEMVMQQCGVNLNHPENLAELHKAFDVLETLRKPNLS